MAKRNRRPRPNQPTRPSRAQVVAKAQQPYSGSTPPPIQQALDARGMGNTGYLGPGRPLNPVTGYSQPPRVMDYPVGVNISTVSRSAWARTSFETLKAVIDAYDVARMCINHKIDELRSMEPMFTPADGVSGDVDAAVDAARAALDHPDGELPFDEWLSKLLEGALRYDATPLYRRRNMAGEVIALEVLDGPTIAPYIDDHGRRPRPPAPAYYQLIHGQVWDWFTSDDIIYRRFRPQTDSPYGLAPIESVLLTVNTDIRFQWHFLQMFTDGSVPAGFIEVPPDVSNPDQVAEWQDYWDAMVLGDQAKLHQLIAVPYGTKINQLRPETFDKTFPTYLMVRTCAAFGVVPQDLGLIEDVNRANGETQVDVQFRVNTLPWVRWVQGILTRYLQNDLRLPVKVDLDTGRDKEDRLAEAQAWQIYIDSGMASVDEGRQELLGLPVDNERPVPRFLNSPRTGPVPLQNILAIAGRVDPETAAPVDDVPLDTTPFDGAGGVLADKSPGGTQFKRAPIDPDEPEFPALEHAVPGSDVIGTKPGAPVIGQPGAVAKAAVDEVAAFARFVKARRKAGRWRDFQFTALDPVEAHRLNDTGRAEIRKAAGDLVAAGLCVQAADTGRVLMMQRGFDPADPASGTWEFPGGHIEDGETAFGAACREWQEETGLLLPADLVAATDPASPGWQSPDGVYCGFVLTLPSEADLNLGQRGQVNNPDDPDGDTVEAIAWWEPGLLAGNPAIRAELAGCITLVHGALGISGGDGVVKADGGGGGPKGGSWRDGAARTPQHHYDLTITDHYAPQVTAALHAAFPDSMLHAAVAQAAQTSGSIVKAPGGDPARDLLRQAARAALRAGDTGRLEQVLRQVFADAYASGSYAAGQQLAGQGGAVVSLSGVSDVDWTHWAPGDRLAAGLMDNGGLQNLLTRVDVTIQGISDTLLDQLGNTIGDGLAAGSPVDQVARSLTGIVTDPARAVRIAHTETARAVTQATLDTYAANGVQRWAWVLSDDACPECEDAAAAGPYPVGGGGDQPPLHPYCRCSATPVTADNSG